MENIIDEVLKIEEQANHYLAQAEIKCRDDSLRMRKRIDEYKETLDKTTREKIRKMIDESERQTRTLQGKLVSEGETRMHKMEEDFAKNRIRWEKQIVQQILYDGIQ